MNWWSLDAKCITCKENKPICCDQGFYDGVSHNPMCKDCCTNLDFKERVHKDLWKNGTYK